VNGAAPGCYCKKNFVRADQFGGCSPKCIPMADCPNAKEIMNNAFWSRMKLK